MFILQRAQRLCLSLTAGLAVVLMASPSVHADEAALAVLPAHGPSWDATSGYGAVEANRATNPLASTRTVITSMVSSDVRWAPASEPTLAAVVAAANAWDLMSGYGSVEANRVMTAQHALRSRNLGSMQEEALFAVVAATQTWDATSGYGSIEAIRAVAATALGPDLSWGATSGYDTVERIRAER